MALFNIRIFSPKKHFELQQRCIKLLNIVSSKVLSSKPEEKDVVDQIFPDIEGSPATIPANYFKQSRHRKIRKLKNLDTDDNVEVDKDDRPNKHVVINCKNNALNHNINQRYDKFKPIPLASKGWFNKQSRGDYFKINIYPDKFQRENVFWSEDIDSYENLGLDDSILKALNKLGFERPTHIQADGIPKIFDSQNVLLAGETGCGKTLAYLLPVVQHILTWRSLAPDRKLNSPLALILAPGRELAYQIADVIDQLARELLFDFDVVIGGHTKRLMTHPNFKPVDLLISTPGAARKLTSTGVYNMSNVRHIVLDEADTVMDDSFSDDIVKYLKRFPISFDKGTEQLDTLPQFCKLTLASATMPTGLPTTLGEIIMPESLVKVETPRLHRVLVHVPQMFLRLGQSQKPSKLLEIAKTNASKDIPTIIFSNRAKVSDWVSMFLNENGVSCINLNGDMPVDIRAGRFDQFQRGFVDTISCTDIASRGLDTIRAKQVLNYDFPVYMADYIHRCGRVGRVGHTDDRLITNFVSNEKEIELVQKIETSVRTMSTLPNVNGNITRIISHKVLKNM